MADLYANVGPRYLNARKAGTPSQVPPRERIPESTAYANVEPRYLHPRHASPLRPTEIPKPIFDSSLHEQLGKKIYRGVGPKYIDPSKYAANEASPRRRLEEERQANKRLYMWRNDTVAASKTTFDDHMKLTKKRMDSLPYPKKTFKAPSFIKDYVDNGTPIRHYSQAHLLEEHAKGGKDAAGSSGKRNVGGGDSPRRAQSPAKSTRSESPGRRWTNAGWQNQSFDDRISEHSASRQSFSREQDRVKQDWERRQKAVVPKDYVPRVAALSPAAMLQQRRDSSRSPTQHGKGELFPPEQSYDLDGEA